MFQVPEESSESGTSNPSQEEVEAVGKMFADFSMRVPLFSNFREQVPEERYWSILTRKTKLSPDLLAEVREPVKEGEAFGSEPSFCLILFASSLSSFSASFGFSSEDFSGETSMGFMSEIPEAGRS